MTVEPYKVMTPRAELTESELRTLRGGARCWCCSAPHKCACGVVTDARYPCTDCGRPSWCKR